MERKPIITVTSQLTGTVFNVFLTLPGQVLVGGRTPRSNTEREAVLEFFDALMDSKNRGAFGSHGQYITSHPLSAMERRAAAGAPMSLWDDVPAWRLDAESIQEVVDAARAALGPQTSHLPESPMPDTEAARALAPHGFTLGRGRFRLASLGVAVEILTEARRLPVSLEESVVVSTYAQFRSTPILTQRFATLSLFLSTLSR